MPRAESQRLQGAESSTNAASEEPGGGKEPRTQRMPRAESPEVRAESPKVAGSESSTNAASIEPEGGGERELHECHGPRTLDGRKNPTEAYIADTTVSGRGTVNDTASYGWMWAHWTICCMPFGVRACEESALHAAR
jgi:hypothetical protein